MAFPSHISALACALLLAAPCADAADLAAHSGIGAVFADPPLHAPLLRGETRDATNAVIAETIYAFQPRIPGYYGRAGDFAYRNYYGTSPVTIFGRDPYACTLIGAC